MKLARLAAVVVLLPVVSHSARAQSLGASDDRPLRVGVGAFDVRDAIRSTSTEQTLTSTNFGVDGGAGIAFRLGKIDGFVETRLQNVYTRDKGLVDTKSIQSFPVSFGITF